MNKYILKDGVPVHEPDLLTWATWFETHGEECIVARTEKDGVVVATDFLAIDYGRPGEGVVLYETTILGGELDGEGKRYSNLEHAVIGHNEMVARVTGPTLLIIHQTPSTSPPTRGGA